jgi:hypothetical protein
MQFATKNVLLGLISLLFLIGGCSDTQKEQVANADTNATPLVIDGYTLPPEPDPKVNNSTLLGIDSNDNGVRDDVERWIYQKYAGKHPIVKEVAMQGARAAQIIIQEPERARETMRFMDAAYYCASYFEKFSKYNKEPILIDMPIIGRDFDEVQFNTTQRARAYGEYNAALSGGVYGTPTVEERRGFCDFNVTELLRNQQ